MAFCSMKYSYVAFSFVALLAVFSFSVSQAFAEQPDFWMADLIASDPYYFSYQDFGMNILKLSGSSMEPYLVPGVTDENSSLEEISKAYSDSVSSVREEVNPPPTERAKIFVVSFSGGELDDIHFTSFLDFEPIQYKAARNAPPNHQQLHHAVKLASLPEKNMEKFYSNIIESYVNVKRGVEPVDITIDVLTGDGHILQSWNYNKCTLVEYTPYRDEVLSVLKLSGKFGAEYADRTLFACVGHNVDFSLRDSGAVSREEIRNSILFPANEEQIKKFAVHFSGGEIPFSGSSFSFSHFSPVLEGENLEPVVGSLVFGSPQFMLSSLPNKNMEEYYHWIELYINGGKSPEPFDVTVDMITGDDSILQTWSYTNCQIVNYVTYFENILTTAKFSGTFAPEFRDRAIYQCSGVSLDGSIRYIEEPDNRLTSDFIPGDHDRAHHIVVHFEGTEISPAKSISTFTRFAPVVDDKPRVLIPSNPLTKSPSQFGTSPKFILEGLPSKDKEWLGEFTTKYINVGKIPELFKASVDVVTGDGSIVQSWDYNKCKITNYAQYFDDNKLFLKSHGSFAPEITERITFDCGGLSFDGTTKQLEEPLTDLVHYADYAPKPEDRATKYVVHFSGGEIAEPHTTFTYSKFEPSFPQSLGPAKNQPYIPKLILEGLSTKDRQQVLLAVSTYINPERPLEPFDVTVDVLTGDDQILQKWLYKKCQFVDAKLLLVNSLATYKIHGGNEMEFRDYFDIECNGLRLDFSLQEPDYEVLDTEKYLKDPHNRLTAIVFRMQNGELESTWSSLEMPMFETKSPKEFLVTALPNKNFFPLMEFFSRYMNPGKAPEPFDIIVDMVAGDGDRITSFKYPNCGFSGGYMYYDDAILQEKIRPQISPEFKARGEVTCSGISANQIFAAMYTVPKNTFTDLSPLKQIQKGIIRNDIVCADGYSKMLAPFKEMPRCVFSENTSRFEERLGWNVVSELDVSFISNPIPKLEDSADTIKVRFSGADFEKEISIDTFVKYVPTASVDSSEPGYAFGSKPLFFLNGLPSKDKNELYEFISKSINSGKPPHPFQISIDILYGDGNGFMSLKHKDCKIERYHISLDRNLLSYKYQGTWQSEIKDRLTMSCISIGGGPVPVSG